ncbi:hypothetical protein B0H11DRAFT_2074004 [Mycena galericulata]|nr:hypothetical protein B0H11DRAFT_2074004 [Mycena galericulata]
MGHVKSEVSQPDTSHKRRFFSQRFIRRTGNPKWTSGNVRAVAGKLYSVVGFSGTGRRWLLMGCHTSKFLGMQPYGAMSHWACAKEFFMSTGGSFNDRSRKNTFGERVITVRSISTSVWDESPALKEWTSPSKINRRVRLHDQEADRGLSRSG